MAYRRKTLFRKKNHKKSNKTHLNKYHRSRKKKTYKKSQKKNRHMRGGYKDTLSNYPYSLGYSTGGIISPNDIALANPAPYTAYAKCGGV